MSGALLMQEKDAIGKQAFNKDEALMSMVVIRTDLPLEQQMVQACHACSLAGSRLPGWSEDTRMAVLGVPDLEGLLKAAQKLETMGVEFCEFYEPDHGIGVSALASQPIPWKLARKSLPHLPLWAVK